MPSGLTGSSCVFLSCVSFSCVFLLSILQCLTASSATSSKNRNYTSPPVLLLLLLVLLLTLLPPGGVQEELPPVLKEPFKKVTVVKVEKRKLEKVVREVIGEENIAELLAQVNTGLCPSLY